MFRFVHLFRFVCFSYALTACLPGMFAAKYKLKPDGDVAGTDTQFVKLKPVSDMQFPDNDSFFYDTGTTISDEFLKNCVVVFVADWCPHCGRFLTKLSKYVKEYNKIGINVLFVGIPDVSKLYDNAEIGKKDLDIIKNKIKKSGCSIKGKGVAVVVLSNSAVLEDLSIKSLPRVLIVSDYKVTYSGVGTKVARDIDPSDSGKMSILFSTQTQQGTREPKAKTTSSSNVHSDDKSHVKENNVHKTDTKKKRVNRKETNSITTTLNKDNPGNDSCMVPGHGDERVVDMSHYDNRFMQGNGNVDSVIDKNNEKDSEVENNVQQEIRRSYTTNESVKKRREPHVYGETRSDDTVTNFKGNSSWQVNIDRAKRATDQLNKDGLKDDPEEAIDSALMFR